jgi:hypothetical protein
MFLQSYNYALCENSVEETVDHLFLHCGIAKDCWIWIGLVVPQSQGPFQVLADFRRQLNVPFFMEIIVLMCWSIWSVRNNLIFRNQEASVQHCKHIFRNVFGLVVLRAKKRYLPQISLWLEKLV